MAVTFHHRTLDNGLTIIAETEPGAHTAAAGFFVKTGARDERSSLMGVSHFLEHMMFKGTPGRSAEELNRSFDRIGARNNAYTSHEMTCFYASVLPEVLLGSGGAVDLISDMMRPALREDDFSTEKNVILEEIAMYDDNPMWVIYEAVMAAHYGDHPLGHRVLGTNETIAALTAGQMREYFERRYSPDNTVVALAGRLDFDAAVDAIAERCGGWRRTGTSRDPGDLRMADHEFTLRRDKVNRAYAIMATPAPGMSDDRRYAASLGAQVLGGSDNSRLHWALVETGLADEAEAGHDARDGTGDFVVSVSCDPDRIDEVWGEVERAVASLSESLTEDDLAKIRTKLATGITVAGERPGGRMQRLGRQWTYLGQYTTLEQELERVSAVTVQQVRDVLAEYPFRPRTIGRLMPA
ncbi:MAG: insulinase family protein [Phycisphaeraceae bacterium]|nr:insulinase family protein [Phycisphaeraceae bacterium]